MPATHRSFGKARQDQAGVDMKLIYWMLSTLAKGTSAAPAECVREQEPVGTLCQLESVLAFSHATTFPVNLLAAQRLSS
jgi:hypothetical protein